MVSLSEVEMWMLIKIVIPTIKRNWKYLAYSMGYNIAEVTAISKDSRDLGECCQKLFINWLETGHGTKPKTYQTLLNHIKEIDELVAASEQIERELIKGM